METNNLIRELMDKVKKIRGMVNQIADETIEASKLVDQLFDYTGMERPVDSQEVVLRMVRKV